MRQTGIMLSEAFKVKALSLLGRYEATGMTVTNQGKTMPFRDFDRKRVESIPEILSLLQRFLDGKLDLKTFKSEIGRASCRERV